jgi:peptidoglycan/LPS O-acetylase OafA/YrhL
MSGYRADIDGLRAVAVLSVVLYHLDPIWLPGGFVGVDVFFVISGFLITRLIVDEVSAGNFSFTHFYIRRIRRIFPALLVMLAAVAVASILLLTPMEMAELGKTVRYAGAQLSNLLFQRQASYFSEGFDDSPLLHTWSLAVEEQFYLIWPPLIIALHRVSSGRWRVVAVAVSILAFGSIAVSQYLVESRPQLAFYSLPSRLWEIALGGLLSVLAVQLRSRVANEVIGAAGLAAIGVSVFTTSSESFPGLGALLPCAGAALLIVAGADARGLVSRILRLRYLVLIGIISYSLYLWHWPLIALFKRFTAQSELGLAAGAVILAASLVLSILSWRYVERPFRRTRVLGLEGYASFSLPGLGSQVRLYHAMFAGLSAAVLVVSVGIYLEHEGSTLSRRLMVLAEDPGMRYSDDRVIDCEVKGDRFKKSGTVVGSGGSCRFPAEAGAGRVSEASRVAIVFGDSHAGHYAKGLMEWFSSHGIPVRLLWASGCAPLFDFEQGDDPKKRARCETYVDLIERLLEEDAEIAYAVMAGRWDAYVGRAGFRESLDQTLRTLEASGKRVVVMGQVPKFAFHPANNYLRDGLALSRWLNLPERPRSMDLATAQEELGGQRGAILEAVAGCENVVFFDPWKYLCRAGRCDSVRDGEMLYYDHDHLNVNGTMYLGRFLGEALSQLSTPEGQDFAHTSRHGSHGEAQEGESRERTGPAWHRIKKDNRLSRPEWPTLQTSQATSS